MRHQQSTDELTERAALYALGSLSQHEARGFENHLRDGCEVCQRELSQFDNVVGLLGLTAPEVEPPASLRNRLLENIRNESRKIPGTAPSPVRSSKQTDSSELFRRGLSRALPWALAACLAVVAAVAFVKTNRSSSHVARLERNLTHEQAAFDRVNERLQEESAIRGALESSGSQRISLQPQDKVPEANRVTVYWNKNTNQWIVAGHLKPPPSGKVYQLWFVTAAKPESAGLIKTDSEGHSFLITKVPQNIGPIAAAAITLEPIGGSAQPTMPILAVGKTG